MKLLLGLTIATALSSLPASSAEKENLSNLIEDDRFPVRVHVFEDYETEIEKRWWLRGREELKNVPPSANSLPNRRAFRAAPSKNFDRKMGDQNRAWKAVIFNPVPGPPMGPHTRLKFRYWLKGTTTLRVQIYSLSNNYHRFLTLVNLPPERWQNATVDLTTARRPDGSGGPLAEDERIDDIQFYIDPAGELLIDDLVLYEAGPKTEKRPFPLRTIFTGWFDTGTQGKEWPGAFEIVPHEKPRTWDAAKSIKVGNQPQQSLRIKMRGTRKLGGDAILFFRYKLAGKAGPLRVSLVGKGGVPTAEVTLHSAKLNSWTEARVKFQTKLDAENIAFLPPKNGTLLIDDLLLYESGAGLASHYENDKELAKDQNVLLATDFETEAWRKDWDGGARPTVNLVDKDPARKFAPLQGKALRIAVTAGGHYGASIEHAFAKTKAGEPEEIYFRYYLRFGDDWDPARGGKLPGISGTYSRAGWGGRKSDGHNGWSARGLFRGRQDNKTPVGFYCYHADMKGTYGDEWLWDRDDLGKLENNRWYCLEQHARMNTPGKKDGVLRAWIDGQLAFERNDLRMRHQADLKIEKIWINLYHGGSWAAKSDDHLYLDNVVIARKYIGPMNQD